MQVSKFMIDDVKTVTKNDTLQKAAKIMYDFKIGSCVVIDNENKPIGIVTRTDVLNHYVQSGDSIDLVVPVDNFIKSKIVTITPEESLDIANQMLSESRLHHLIVVDKDGKLAGVLSTLDIIDLQHKRNKAYPYFLQ
jgi:CBS domain-containing protein